MRPGREALETPHFEHLKALLACGPPTWQHQHHPAPMSSLLEYATRLTSPARPG
jgi:hypothetical protein